MMVSALHIIESKAAMEECSRQGHKYLECGECSGGVL
jgi:hypothetical protein